MWLVNDILLNVFLYRLAEVFMAFGCSQTNTDGNVWESMGLHMCVKLSMRIRLFRIGTVVGGNSIKALTIEL